MVRNCDYRAACFLEKYHDVHVLAIGRAMGETMAVMMVIGNANLFPHLLGKSESIASVIALEMEQQLWEAHITTHCMQREWF